MRHWVAGRHRPPGVESCFAAGGLEVLGLPLQSRVEVEGVGQVELAVDPAGAVERDVVVVPNTRR